MARIVYVRHAFHTGMVSHGFPNGLAAWAFASRMLANGKWVKVVSAPDAGAKEIADVYHGARQ